MIHVPPHTKNSRIGEDIRREKGNPVVIFRKNHSFFLTSLQRFFFSKVVIASFLILSIIFYTSRIPALKAETTIFYPKSCLGGFVGASLAEGKPETKIDGDSSDFDRDNSAYLEKNESAEMYCGNFDGEVLSHTSPTDITLTLFLTSKENTSTTIKNDSSASSTTFLEVLDATGTPILENKESSTTGGGGEATDTIKDAAGTGASGGDSNVPTQSPEPPVTPVEDIHNSPQQGGATPAGDTAPQTFLQRVIPFALSFVSPVFAEEQSDSAATVSVPAETPKESDTPSGTPVPSKEVSPAPSDSAQVKDSSQGGASSATSSDTTVAPLPIKTDSDSDAKPTELGGGETKIDDKGDKAEKEGILSEIENAFSKEQVSKNTSTSTEHALYEVSYNIGGDEWTPIAFLGKENTRTVSLSIPASNLTSWSDVGKLQVRIKSAETLDARDDLYVDGMSVVIHYSKEKTTEREYSIQDIENAGNDLMAKVGGSQGGATMLSVTAKEKLGLAIYNIDTGALVLSTETNADKESNFDPNGMFPEYGSYALVLTEDQNWCSDKKVDECVATSTFKGVSFFNLFGGKGAKESGRIKELKKGLVDESYSLEKEKEKKDKEEKEKNLEEGDASSTKEVKNSLRKRPIDTKVIPEVKGESSVLEETSPKELQGENVKTPLDDVVPTKSESVDTKSNGTSPQELSF